MVLCYYENWGFYKRVVSDCHTICMQLVGFHQGVIRVFTHTYPFFEDSDCGIPCLRIVVCCGCLNYWNCLAGLVCVSVWSDVTLIARKMHDDAVGTAKNCVRV